MEHADVQRASALAAMAEPGDWTEVTDHDDLAGRPRYLVARRTPAAPA
jgi:release factor glutamine methyltransferase